MTRLEAGALRVLIVNPDDCGLTPAVSRGILRAHREGIVTRGILFDATLLPGFATPEGWVEPLDLVRKLRPASFRTGVRVLAIDDGLTVRTDRGTVRAETVVIALTNM